MYKILYTKEAKTAIEKLSLKKKRQIKEAVERIGSSRIIFGIDGPHELPDTVTYARSEIEKIRKLNLNPQDESAILGGNIAFLIGI